MILINAYPKNQKNHDIFYLSIGLYCAKLGVLYAKESERFLRSASLSPKALSLKIVGIQLSWNFLTPIKLQYKQFHLDDTFWNYW